MKVYISGKIGEDEIKEYFDIGNERFNRDCLSQPSLF